MIEIVGKADTISVAVPGVLVGGKAPSSLTDRGLSLRSLSLPQAALPSLPFCILHFEFCIFVILYRFWIVILDNFPLSFPGKVWYVMGGVLFPGSKTIYG